MIPYIRTRIFSFCILLLTNSCYVYTRINPVLCHIQRYNQLDLSEKSITVPWGAKDVQGTIKQALRDSNWHMEIYRGTRITRGRLGKKVYLKHYTAFKTRYTLLISSAERVPRKYEYSCDNLGGIVKYNISVLDNKTGKEVFTIAGSRDCRQDVTDAFIDEINGVLRKNSS